MNNLKKTSPLLLLLAFIAVYFIWGTTYLAIVYALKGFKPFTISALRYLTAGLILTIWVMIKKIGWPEKRDLKVLIISGILMLSGGSGLVVVGEQYINSGFAAVIVGTEPLFFVLLDRQRWSAYFSSKWIITGLLLGFAGIALFAHFAPAGSTLVQGHPVIGTIITLLSAVSWVTGALYANRKLPAKSDNLVNSTVQLLAAGLFSGLVAFGKGEWFTLSPTTIPLSAWAGLAYLVIMGSLVAYLSFTWLITVQPPAIVSTHTYVNPVIAIVMGWLLAAEQISFKQIIALVIIMTGVIITQLNKQKMVAQS
ncbi:EamA family transporter [Mucilaginibacter sp. SG564]|uniref:EamA family transporter n=1 Tax=unclassified Mucilaginibacter TaxID=2617802 RepID=UPI001553312C|nr:EamA family transporter [Mucilaginibacter sp. SG564]NOW93511.1 drug/metabolite transporter (DMT)-like permease [Mucilaginibacter sp. SG564]